MRCRLHSLGRELGTVDLHDGIEPRDVVEAMRKAVLFCTPLPAAAAPPAAAAATSSTEPTADRGQGRKGKA